jgi:hypothetical protein
MKRTNMLFVLAACAAPTKHPLTYSDGSPACGNIGQTGRATPHEATVMPQPVVQAAVQVVRTTIARPLLRLMAADSHEGALARPLLTDEDRPAAGNVMSKGKPRRVAEE